MKSLAISVLYLLFACWSSRVAANCVGNRFNNTAPPIEVVTTLVWSNTPDRIELNLPPRYMWGWGGKLTGYCGSVSLQTSALYFGTWFSEQFPRYAAKNGDTEILIGDGGSVDNFDRVADQLRLRIDHFNTAALSNPQTDLWLQWAQQHLVAGHPVIGGVYALFWNGVGDSDYDHIIPVVGLTSNGTLHSFSGNGQTNVTSVLYNDLYSNFTRAIQNPLDSTRSDFYLNSSTNPTQPYSYTLPLDADYGVAVLGIVDDNSETYRTKLTAWSWTEPDWGNEDGCGEAPMPLNLSVAVFGLTAGKTYAILRFDGNTSIPRSGFLAANYTARWDFVATGQTYVASPFDTVMTNTVASYRTVLALQPSTTPLISTTAPATLAPLPTTGISTNPTAAPTTTTQAPTSPATTSSSAAVPTTAAVSPPPSTAAAPETSSDSSKPIALYVVAVVGVIVIIAGCAVLMVRFRDSSVAPKGAHRINDDDHTDAKELYAAHSI